MSTTEEKMNNVHKLNKVFPYAIKIIVLIAVAIIAVVFSQDFFGALLNTLTFLITTVIDIDSVRRRSSNVLDLSFGFVVFQVVLEIIAVATFVASIIGVAWVAKEGCNVLNYD